MRVMKVCHACDRILGEVELDDLTGGNSDPIMNVVGNVSYTLCPECLKELEITPGQVFH